MIGPTPNSSVSDVFDALTATRMRRCDSFSCSSSLRTSLRSSTARSWRACSTGVAGSTAWSNASASEALSSLAIPPGASAAWRRHTTRVRWLPMSMFRFANSRSTSAWSAARTGGSPGDRSAATATDSASFGSFLFDRLDASSLTLDASVAGTSMTCSPASTSCWGQQIAKTGGGLDRPHALPERFGPRQQLVHLPASRADLDRGQFAFVSVDRDRRVRRLVRVDTDDHRHEFLHGLVVGDRGGHSCFGLLVHVPLSSHNRGEAQSGRLFVRKPAGIADGRHFVSYPTQDLETLRIDRDAQHILKQAPWRRDPVARQRRPSCPLSGQSGTSSACLVG